MKSKQRLKMAGSPICQREYSGEGFEGLTPKSTMEPVLWRVINKVEQDCDKLVKEMRKQIEKS